jgi:hypothetical protein
MKSKNLKFVLVFFLSIAMLMSISACSANSDAGADTTGSDSAATEAPAATDAAATEAPAAATSGDVVPAYVFTNTGSVEICQLFLSTVDTNDWGPDQLGGATIPAGQTFTLKNVPAGKYDAKVVGCNGAGESSTVLDIHN